ncbi:MAG: hypothetical protein JO360_03990 [Acidobacteria bacterium]|nr:hypothetical protein [Acidobacteriota bacterium]
MTRLHAKSLSLAVLLLSVLCVKGLARLGPDETAQQNSFTSEAALKEVADYRRWTRVTEKPLVTDFASAGG